MSTDYSTTRTGVVTSLLETLSGRGKLDRLSLFSLLAEAAYALYRGRTKLAVLLVAAAALATRWRWVSYITQAVLTAYRILRKLR